VQQKTAPECSRFDGLDEEEEGYEFNAYATGFQFFATFRLDIDESLSRSVQGNNLEIISYLTIWSYQLSMFVPPARSEASLVLRLEIHVRSQKVTQVSVLT